MPDTKKESLAALLSPSRESMNLVNVKFFRGARDLIRPEEFRAQLRAIAEQHTGGAKPASNAPRSNKSKTNIRELVTSL